MVAAAVGGKGDGGRYHHADHHRRGGDEGDLARAKPGPVEPDRQIGQLRAGDHEEGGKQQRDAGRKTAPLPFGSLAAH
ncbi:MAG TPA: hypothetical protein VG758_04925 [Hyphomicrobiaceae bacterium]|jgi:hypothetical protein|nr:hypothetical protein [Hyphomicrobiaceae bacterium]